MIKRKIILYLISLFIINLTIYLNLANSFIYFRIGEGNLVNPLRQQVYYMSSEKTGPKIKYVAIGDSLTSGVGAEEYQDSYPYLLAERMAQSDGKIVFKNFSQPGLKTQDLIDFMITPAVKENPDVITLLIGVNDIHNHVGGKQFKENYEYILKRLTSETKAKIYLINIPLIGSNTIIFPPYNYYFDKETDNYNEIIKELAQTYQVKYIDLNTPTKNLLKKDGPHYSVDSFHPSSLGYKLWAQIIYDRLNY